MASCSATLWCIAQGARQVHSNFRQKKAPIKGLFRHALRSVLASPEATTRIGTVNAIEITVYSYIILVKQKFRTSLNAENDRAQAQTTTPLSSLPISSKTAFVSILVPNMSRGRFSPRPCTGEFIHFAAATVSFSYRERASSTPLLMRPGYRFQLCSSVLFSPCVPTSEIQLASVHSALASICTLSGDGRIHVLYAHGDCRLATKRW